MNRIALTFALVQRRTKWREKGVKKQAIWAQKAHSSRMDFSAMESYLMRGEYPEDFSKVEIKGESQEAMLQQLQDKG